MGSSAATGARAALRSVASLIRLYQWPKNVLVLVPIATSHRLDAQAWITGIAAFLAFSLCSSAAYVINDFADREADRAHAVKRQRPFANGALAPGIALPLAGVLLAAAFAIAALLPLNYLAIQGVYFVIAIVYTLVLKRHAMIDVVALACLYTLRVLAGGAATGIAVSEWLLTFSFFLFFGLALIKRYEEFSDAAGGAGRFYRAIDRPVLGALAAAASFNALTIFTLYISSPDVHELYGRPQLLWLALPILAYWIGRIVMLAFQGRLKSDPVLFALTDPASLGCAVLMAGVLALAAPL